MKKYIISLSLEPILMINVLNNKRFGMMSKNFAMNQRDSLLMEYW